MIQPCRSRALRFGPPVLALFLLFLVVADAGAGCLVAWLCPPPAESGCGDEPASAAWQQAEAACAPQARLDGVSQKLDPIQLPLLGELATTPFGGGVSPAGEAWPDARSGNADPPRPLFRLHGALLI